MPFHFFCKLYDLEWIYQYIVLCVVACKTISKQSRPIVKTFTVIEKLIQVLQFNLFHVTRWNLHMWVLVLSAYHVDAEMEWIYRSTNISDAADGTDVDIADIADVLLWSHQHFSAFYYIITNYLWQENKSTNHVH